MSDAQELIELAGMVNSRFVLNNPVGINWAAVEEVCILSTHAEIPLTVPEIYIYLHDVWNGFEGFVEFIKWQMAAYTKVEDTIPVFTTYEETRSHILSSLANMQNMVLNFGMEK